MRGDLVAKSEATLLDEMARIDAELLSRAPTALDGALLLVERKSVYEALYPETARGGDRKSTRYQEIKTKRISFCSDTAERLGLSERSVLLAVKMGEDLAPFADTLRNTPIVDNAAALRSFAELEAKARNAVLDKWRENAKLSFSAVLIAARLRAREDNGEISFQRLVDAWARAGSKERRRFLTEIGVEASAAEAAVTAARKSGGA